MKFRTKKVVPANGAGEIQVQLSVPLYGVLRDVQEAFFGLCVEAGKATLSAMMEADRERLCGAKGRPDNERRAYRGGHSASSVVLGGRRIGVQRPRARQVEGGELALPTFTWAAGTDPLNRATMQAIAAGVTTRRYRRTLDPLPAKEQEWSVSKSAVSRRFVELSAEQVQDWLTRKLTGIDLPIVMVDGIYFADRVVLVALGIDPKGKKHVLGLREGTTEKTQVVRAMLADLIERGLDADRPRLWVIDGGKALRRAIVQTFGASALIQRCQEHKRRNVLDHLPEALLAGTSRAMREAWNAGDAKLARRQLERLVARLAKDQPSAAASLREGMDETLTLQNLGIGSALYVTLRTTNPIENLNGSIAVYTRNVKRWRDGEMLQRWIASALTDASQRFRALRGYRDMPKLIQALQAHSQSHDAVQRKVA
jgi:transposase-like protein